MSAHNLNQSAQAYLQSIAVEDVQQFHLAGYQINPLEDGNSIYIDTHGQNIQNDVWTLYDAALKKFGNLPVLLEWDTDIPPLEVLLAEAEKVNARWI